MNPRLLNSVLFALLLSCCTGLVAQEFVNPLQVPPLISYENTNYHLNVIETEHNFNPQGSDSLNTLVPTFAFEDADNPGTTTILGPTIAWEYRNNVSPMVTNNLSEVTTCHWHGAHVPQSADGGPHSRIQPGDTWHPAFEILDKPATMWYHPHAMGLTYKHVQMGLSGMIYVEDASDVDPTLSFINDILPHEYGVDDIPLIFQTKKFTRDAADNIVIQAEEGYKKDYTYLVNGIKDPVMTVPADMLRLRLLNGDGKFAFNFAFKFADGDDFPAQLIATDAGYTDRTYQISSILMSPGERTEWLLDLRRLEGETLYVHNLVSEIPNGVIGNSATTQGYAANRDLLKIIVGPSTQWPSPIIAFPINLYPSEIPSLDEVTNTRVKTFRKDSFMVDGRMRHLFNIDSTLMDMMVVNDVVKMDSTEIWTIRNTTNIAHPWHIHDIHFYVTEILENGIAVDPIDYPQLFSGPKDNILVMPGWELSYIATFSDYGTRVAPDSSYMYHCHILPHEDNGMMGQFVVWNGLGDPSSVADPRLSSRSMSLYPNPTQGHLFIEGGSTSNSTVRIYNLQGQKLSEVNLPPFDEVIGINVSNLPKGMTIVEWESKEGKAVSRLVID